MEKVIAQFVLFCFVLVCPVISLVLWFIYEDDCWDSPLFAAVFIISAAEFLIGVVLLLGWALTTVSK